MSKSKTPSFITEIPLRVDQNQERTLLVRLDTARQMYNAVLGEALRRLAVMRNSERYKQAKELPKKIVECTEAFAVVRKQYQFSEYDLHSYASEIKQSWLGDHLDINTVQKVASRAFKAVNDYCFGLHGKPRFKGKGQFDSVEGKSNKQGIRWKNGAIHWSGLELKAIIDESDLVLMHGLSCPIKYVRIVRRKFDDHNRFFAQLKVDPFVKTVKG